MTDEEGFSVYLAGLNPHLKEQVGTHVRGNLEEAIAMAQRIEIYQGGNSKTKGQRVKNFQKKKKVLLVKCKDNPLERRPKLKRFSHNRKRSKSRRERANHRREDANQVNVIAVKEIIL